MKMALNLGALRAAKPAAEAAAGRLRRDRRRGGAEAAGAGAMKMRIAEGAAEQRLVTVRSRWGGGCRRR